MTLAGVADGMRNKGHDSGRAISCCVNRSSCYSLHLGLIWVLLGNELFTQLGLSFLFETHKWAFGRRQIKILITIQQLPLKNCGAMHTRPQPLEQHLKYPEHDKSEVQPMRQIPTVAGGTRGQNPGFWRRSSKHSTK